MSEIVFQFPETLVLLGAQALANTDWDKLSDSIQQYYLRISKSGIDCDANPNLKLDQWDKYAYGIYKGFTRNSPEWWGREPEEGRAFWRHIADRGWRAMNE